MNATEARDLAKRSVDPDEVEELLKHVRHVIKYHAQRGSIEAVLGNKFFAASQYAQLVVKHQLTSEGYRLEGFKEFNPSIGGPKPYLRVKW